MKKIIFSLLLLSTAILAQDNGNTRLFANPFVDVINSTDYLESSFVYSEDLDNSRGHEYLRLDGNYNYDNFTFALELASGLDGFNLAMFGARYNTTFGNLSLSAGGMLDVSQWDRVALFTAARYPVAANTILTGSYMRRSDNFFEDSREVIGFGGIYTLSEKINIIAQSVIHSTTEYYMAGAGVEYNFYRNYNIRSVAYFGSYNDLGIMIGIGYSGLGFTGL